MVQTIFNRDPNLRPSIQNIKQSYFFQDVDWSYLENSFSNEIVDIRAILNAIATRKQLDHPWQMSSFDWVKISSDWNGLD